MVLLSIQNGRLEQPQILHIHHRTDLHIRRKSQSERINIYLLKDVEGSISKGIEFLSLSL
jgi:hypothetical protein